MNRTIISILTILILGTLLLLGGCSEPSEREAESPHPEGWADPGSPNFHGSQNINLSTCAACHGDDFQGGSSELSCYSCHQYPHQPDWSSLEIHGASVISADFSLEACSDCHLNTFSADSSSWDCWSCHSYFPHTEGMEDYKHGGAVRTIGYRVWVCQSCHGDDYSGGLAGVSCLTCHAYSPEACNTCHGTFNADPAEITSWAPPANLLGQISTSLATVGAHQNHVNPEGINTIYIGGPYACGECHILPASLDASTHLDSLPPQAEITFGPLATDGNQVNPAYNTQYASCAATYCHGNFEFGHTDNPASWTTQNGSQIQCDQCHGMPPENEDHPQVSACYLCHASVVDLNNNIIAAHLHVNGEANF